MDSDLCRTVISKSFPQLNIEDVQSLEEAIKNGFEGWDCDAYIVNREFIFLFPRHQYAADSLKLQGKLLQELRSSVTIRVPEFHFFSDGCSEFPNTFVGYRVIEGVPLTENLFKEVCTENVAQGVAFQMAEFLSELHRFPIEKAKELGVPSVPEKDRWADFYRDVEKRVFQLLDRSEQSWTTKLFEDFLACEDNFRLRPVLTHGDLSPEHILFDPEKKRISGIIDFGDVRVGDPAYDFQFDYGEHFLKLVLDHYQGEIDGAFFTRLEFYHRRWPFHEILYGQHWEKAEHIERGMEDLRKIVSAEGARS